MSSRLVLNLQSYDKSTKHHDCGIFNHAAKGGSVFVCLGVYASPLKERQGECFGASSLFDMYLNEAYFL